jgi:hypothetical protein
MDMAFPRCGDGKPNREAKVAMLHVDQRSVELSCASASALLGTKEADTRVAVLCRVCDVGGFMSF